MNLQKRFSYILVQLQFLFIGLIVFVVMLSFRFSWIGLILVVAGLAIGLRAVEAHKRIKRHNFRILPELQEGCELVTHGIYRYVRHPMYSAVMLMMLGVALMTPFRAETVGMWTALCVVLIFKALREERLWCGHDARYETYKRKVKRFIPFIV